MISLLIKHLSNRHYTRRTPMEVLLRRVRRNFLAVSVGVIQKARKTYTRHVIEIIFVELTRKTMSPCVRKHPFDRANCKLHAIPFGGTLAVFLTIRVAFSFPMWRLTGTRIRRADTMHINVQPSSPCPWQRAGANVNASIRRTKHT